MNTGGAQSPAGERWRQLAKRLLPPLVSDLLRRLRTGSGQARIKRFLKNGAVPWSPGYEEYRRRLIREALGDEGLLARFRRGEPLPTGYGAGVDERCVEYPWLLSRLDGRPERMLDAGSSLNHEFILDQPALRPKTLHVLTLAPEREAFWQRGISYIYGDLRDLPIQDGFYDCVACISTLEHVGFDNSQYLGRVSPGVGGPDDCLLAVKELRRVLKPGGTLLLTVPFGVALRLSAFQQFDRAMLDRALQAFGAAQEKTETFYRYTSGGWSVARAEECSACEYVTWLTKPRQEWPAPLPVEPDRAAAARAVACVRAVKG
jgi:SAM-dependent methyltransferase